MVNQLQVLFSCVWQPHKILAQLFSDSGLKSYEYEMTGKISEAANIGKSVGEELLKLAGSEFKKKWIF